MELHRLLARQLRRTGGSAEAPPTDPAAWQDLLARISRAYSDAEADRYTLERAMEISSRELREAVDAALVASRAKSSFLANMSHEIRTPMNGVVGAADLLADTPMEPHQKELVETIRRSGECLLLLIDDILDLSRVESGKLLLVEREFDVAEVVADVTDMLAERAQQRRVELGCFVMPDISSTLRGDPDRLRQVLLNLVGNAVKFTEKGQVRVLVKLLHREAGREVVWFEVADTGVGIDRAAGQRLFHPFTQGDDSTTRRFGGTGLGLSICKRLVELMNGEIGFDSMPGKGSTFWFHVELGRTAAVRAAAHATDLRGLRVLFVDDNATNRQLMRWQLRPHGIGLDLADSGAAGIDRVAAAEAAGRPYDVVVFDHLMPEMDGVQMAHVLRERQLCRNSRLVLLSSSYGVGDEHVRSLELHACLRKPVRSRELVSVLRAVGQPASVVAAGAAGDDTVAPVGSGLCVLLAEDNRVNQHVARKMLEYLGCQVVVVDDGAEAVRQFRAQAFDLVLMDCQMPVLGGIEATQRIREWEGAEARVPTPILALTANAMPSDRLACMGAGMTDVLTKPVRKAALAEALRELFRPQPSGG